MTRNSVLCNFIRNHKNNWRELLSDAPYYITIKNDGDLYIFNYSDPSTLYEIAKKKAKENGLEEVERLHTDFSLPEVQESRGIILEVTDNDANVVCWPFRKFGNYGESYADAIDWSSARVQEKVDGSIVKMYHYNGEWHWATNSSLHAKESAYNGPSFYDIICTACDNICGNSGAVSGVEKLQNYASTRNWTDYTFIFELISPNNKIIVNYGDETSIIFTGVRNNKTGQEFHTENFKFPFPKLRCPKEYHLNSLEEAIAAANMINESPEKITGEGFVVVDKDFNRIKIKSPDYVQVHYATFHSRITKRALWDVYQAQEAEEFLTYYPAHRRLYEQIAKSVEDTAKYISDYIKSRVAEITDDMSRHEVFDKIKSDGFLSKYVMQYYYGLKEGKHSIKDIDAFCSVYIQELNVDQKINLVEKVRELKEQDIEKDDPDEELER
jgi:T4 RnlA family RNA ligase